MLILEANFGRTLRPQRLTSSQNSDSTDIAKLAYHILFNKELTHNDPGSRQKTLQIGSRGKQVSIDPDLSAELVDFLEACDRGDVDLLLRVSKPNA